MRRILALLLCSFTFVPAAYAQEEGPPIEAPPGMLHQRNDFFGSESDSTYASRYIFEAGLTNIRPWALNNTLFGYGNAGFGEFTTIGFGEGYSEETNDDDEGSYIGNDATISMHWFRAQKLNALSADSSQMSYRMKGWELMTSLFAFNFIRNEHVDLIVGYGTFWGTMKLQAENMTANTGRMLYKNPFVAPAVRTELRFNFGPLTLGGRFTYRYDITRDNWKRFDDNIDPLPGFRFRDTQFMAYIGFRVRDSY